MSKIYWDTMIFIYWLEEDPNRAARVGAIHESMERRGDELCTSTLTLGEVLVEPLRRGAAPAAQVFREMLAPPRVRLIPLTVEVSERYAQIRATNRLKAAAAIHLASAASAGVNLFLTHDRELTRLRIPGIDFIAPLDVSLF